VDNFLHGDEPDDDLFGRVFVPRALYYLRNNGCGPSSNDIKSSYVKTQRSRAPSVSSEK
jgi:hypothetical protein